MKALNVGKYALLATALLLVTGCSMRRFALENYGWLSTRLAVSYLDLDGAQKETFKTTLAKTSERIRERHLPDTIAIVQSLADATDPIPALERLEVRFRLVVADACDEFAPLVASLSPAQLEHLKGKLAEREEKYDPTANGGVAALRKRQSDESREMATRWLGTLTSRQEELLDGASLVRDDEGQWERDYLAYRADAQGAFLRLIVAGRGNPSLFGHQCRRFGENQDPFLTDAGRQMRVRMRDRRNTLTSALFASIQPDQRSHFRLQINGLVNDLGFWSEQIANQ